MEIHGASLTFQEHSETIEFFALLQVGNSDGGGHTDILKAIKKSSKCSQRKRDTNV